jgi:nucleoside 2-deoxyribosyltransferase
MVFPIYIAGSWTDRKQISQTIDCFRDNGYSITHDWTVDESENVDSKTEDDCRKCAINDIRGVKNSKAVVAIMDNPKYSYRGTNCEIGCALGLNIPVFIYNPLSDKGGSYCSTNVFYWHTGIQRFKELTDLTVELDKLKHNYNNTNQLLTFNAELARQATNTGLEIKKSKQFKKILGLIKKQADNGESILKYREPIDQVLCIQELKDLSFEITTCNKVNTFVITW